MNRFRLTPTWGDIQFSKHKFFEYQFELGKNAKRFANGWFECRFRWRRRQDHGGLYFTFSTLKLFWMSLNIYDRRHWDDDNNCYKKYNV